jgi:hypothetical protein
MKICPKCGLDKDIEEFRRDRNSTDGRSYVCKSCIKSRRYIQKPQIYSEEKRRIATYKYEYGISIEKYNELFKQQEDRCAICKETNPELKRLPVDHCHKTLTVRGLLCGSCNRALGLFKDDVKRIQEAINYLSKERKIDLFEVLLAFRR